jgi:hypothetical protein
VEPEEVSKQLGNEMGTALAIPTSITQGDTVRWQDTLPSYPADLYTLTYQIKGATSLTVTATAIGQDYSSTLTPAQTSTLTPGGCWVQASVTNPAGDRYTVGSGLLTVLPNLATASTPYPTLTEAEESLAAVRKAIKTILEGGAVASYSIRGRNLSRYSLAELRSLELELRQDVQRELKAAGLLNTDRRMLVNWGGPSRLNGWR